MIVVVASLAVAGFGYFSTAADGGSDRFYLRNNGGSVLFTHGGHQARSISCEQCHHELIGAAGACTECHDDSYAADMATHADLLEIPDHSCSGCHAIAAAAAAHSCRTCHPKEAAEGESVHACADCHDDSYGPDLATHADLLEIEDHTCDGCHTARALADAYHANCNACHLRVASSRFASDDGKPACESCHLR